MAYAAAMAAGLDGIVNETEPPEMFSGDVYQAADFPRVPLRALLRRTGIRVRQRRHRLGTLAILERI